MEIEQSVVGPVTRIAPVGRIDSYSARDFESHIMAVIGNGAAVVVDLDRLDYISSAGLRVLLLATKQARAQNARLALAAMQKSVREVFDISGFSSIFEIHGSAEEAIAALSSR